MAAFAVPRGTLLPEWECLMKESDDERVTSTWQPLGWAKSCASVGRHIVFSNKWPCLTLSSSSAVGKVPSQVCFSSWHLRSSALTSCSSWSSDIWNNIWDKTFGCIQHFSVAQQYSHSLSALMQVTGNCYYSVNNWLFCNRIIYNLFNKRYLNILLCLSYLKRYWLSFISDNSNNVCCSAHDNHSLSLLF